MSRDYTSDDWVDTILHPRRRDLDELTRHLRHVRTTARAEGRGEGLKEALEEIEAMPKNGNSAQKLAARRVQNTLNLRYTEALNLVNQAKVDGCNWGQAADAVILEANGEGLPETEGDAQ